MAGFAGRHPLFLAALAAAAGVFAAGFGIGPGLAGSALAALAGWGWRSRRTALLWGACAAVAAAGYLIRIDGQEADRERLLAASGLEVRGRALKDARGGADFWQTQAVLLEGPRPGAIVWWRGSGGMPVAGSELRARGNFGPLREPRNPGEFDQATWLWRQGVAAEFLAGGMSGSVTTGPWAARAAALRRGFRAAVTDGLAEDSTAAAVIRAVVIGEPPPDAEALVADFRNSGTLHAFSVSGLHVAMTASLGWCVLSAAGVSRRWAVAILLPLVFGYAWITGNSPPAVRSAWMAAVFLGAFVFRRRPDLLNSLGAVLLVAAFWDGRLLFLPGVQLSYGVVAAIALGVGAATRLFQRLALPPLYLPVDHLNRWQKAWLWVRRWAVQSLGVSVAAAIGSAPLTAWHFGLVTPVSVLAGLVVVPVVFGILAIALFSAAVHPLAPPVARLANRMNGRLADFCAGSAAWFAAIPGGHSEIRADRRPRLLVYDLERGAGAAVFAGAAGEAVLLDCGSPASFRYTVAPSLRRLGLRPDSVVLSHPDGGHLGGGEPVWRSLPIRQAWLPVEKSRSAAYRAWISDSPAAGVRPHGGSGPLAFPDGARLEILHLPDPTARNALADDRVAVFRLHWHGWKLLFTSDAGVGTEEKLLASGRDLTADVLIAGRHRTDLNLGDRFIAAVGPRAIIASNAEFPPSEHLPESAAAYWRSRGIRVFDQRESGGVTMHCEPGGLRLDGFADGSSHLLSR